MEVYEAVYSDFEKQGVYGISLVENPAMEDEWIALSEQPQKIEFTAVDDKKRLLLGAALIPNKKIYRNNGGHEFYITFSEETIGKLAHDFLRKGFQNNSSAEHEVKLSDVSFVESWQVEDSKVDKSALYGKEYEKGTWVTMAKVSDEIYEQATNGTFKGFSIDALLGLEQLQLNNNKKSKNMFSIDDLKGLKEVLFSKSENETSETVNDIEVQAEEVNEVETEVTETQETQEASAINQLKEILAEFKADSEKRFTEMEAKFSKEVKEKDQKIEELETQLSKEPEAEPIKAKPEAKNVVELTAKTKKGRLYEFLNSKK